MGARLAGHGQGRFRLNQNSELNVTPFVDVMLVLLIIFMVTAPLATVAIKIDAPPTLVPPGIPPQPTLISIADDGQVYVSGAARAPRPSALASLPSDVAAALGVAQPTHERILIRADRHVTYGRFMAVIDRLKTAGYDRLGLVTENLQT